MVSLDLKFHLDWTFVEILRFFFNKLIIHVPSKKKLTSHNPPKEKKNQKTGWDMVIVPRRVF